MRRLDNLALIVALSGAAGCRAQTGDAQRGRPLTLVVSGDTAGRIVPCGCTSNQSGGLPRRGSYVSELRGAGDVILADVGGAPAGTSTYDRLKFEALLRGESAMRLVAHNLGAAEVALGAAELRRLAAQTGIAWLSANVRDQQGRCIGQPLVSVNAGGRSLALIGVLAERFATPELSVSPPRQAVLETLRQASRSFDAVVVLAYLPEDELRQLAEAVPEADVIVGGPTGQPVPPTRMGPVLVASATNQGKFLARLDAPAQRTGRWSGQIVELDGRFADHLEQLDNLRRFYHTLAERDVSAAETSFATSAAGELRAGGTVAGSESCRECHAEDCQVWDDSQHAAAWKSLRSKGAEVDPDCQRCHTTGYGQPGGFVSARRSADRTDVGCESCHGPSRAHVADPDVPTPYAREASRRCTGCHDRENSPEFKYETYWAKIRHGE